MAVSRSGDTGQRFSLFRLNLRKGRRRGPALGQGASAVRRYCRNKKDGAGGRTRTDTPCGTGF